MRDYLNRIRSFLLLVDGGERHISRVRERTKVKKDQFSFPSKVCLFFFRVLSAQGRMVRKEKIPLDLGGGEDPVNATSVEKAKVKGPQKKKQRDRAQGGLGKQSGRCSTLADLSVASSLRSRCDRTFTKSAKFARHYCPHKGLTPKNKNNLFPPSLTLYTFKRTRLCIYLVQICEAKWDMLHFACRFSAIRTTLSMLHTRRSFFRKKTFLGSPLLLS